MEVCEDLGSVVDEFAKIRAKIADLQEKEENLKAILVASQETAIVGKSHKVSVNWVSPKPAPDYKAVVSYLKVGPETLDMFMVEKNPYVTVRVFGR